MFRNTVDFLTIELFSNILPTSLKIIKQLSKQQFYKKGTIILNAREIQNTFLYLIKGWIKLTRESAEGEEIIVDILTGTHYCGEQFLFELNTAEPYTVVAAAPVTVLTIPLQELSKLIKADHQLSLNFFKKILEKKQTLDIELEHLSIQNASQRIGCFILRLCNSEKGNTAKVKFPYDKFLLAAHLGMRAETFSRALTKLIKQCDIQIEHDNILVNNIKKLSCFVCQHCSKTFPCKCEAR